MARLPSSDVWVLYAIALASSRRPAGLEDIIAHGDFLNHAILTCDELSYAFARLLDGGYITADRLRFSLSPAFRDTYKAVDKRHRGIWET